MVWMQKDGATRAVRSRFFNPSGWGAPEYLQDPSSSARRNVEMAARLVMNDDGVAIAAWFEDTDPASLGYFHIGVNNRGPGGGWQPSGSIVDAVYTLPARPLLALGAADVGTLVTYDDNNLGGKKFDPASTPVWGPGYALIASPLTGDDILCANVAVAGQGQAFVVWISQGTVGTRVFSGHSGSVDPWEMPDLLDSGGAGQFGCPDIAVDDDGEALATWTDNQSGVSRLKTRRYHDGGWDTTTTVVDTGGKGAFAPSLRLSPDGRGTLLWEQSTQMSDPTGAAPRDLWALHYSGSGRWSPSPASLGATAHATAERMAVTAGGETLVVWIQGDAVWANRWAYADAKGWGTAAALDPFWSTPQGSPDVAMDGSGAGMAIWEQELPQGGDPQICWAEFR